MSKTTIPRGGITADAINGTLIADDAIDSEHYTDGSIDTAHIGDNQVTAAKATGVGNLVKIGTVATDNSNVSALTIDNCFSSTYDMYRIVGYHSATSAGAHNYFRWRTGGSSGSSYTSSDYQWINDGAHIKSEPLYEEYRNWNYSSNHARVGSAMDVDADSSYVTFDLLVTDPNTNVMSRAQVTGTSCLRMTADDKWTTHHVAITNASNVNATGFEMTVSTGSINYGRVTVYGLAQ